MLWHPLRVAVEQLGRIDSVDEVCRCAILDFSTRPSHVFKFAGYLCNASLKDSFGPLCSSIMEEEDDVCDVCRSSETGPDDVMILCDACNVAVHAACYSITAIPGENVDW
jgi:hypothetical protein